jgi:hypothetical protein
LSTSNLVRWRVIQVMLKMQWKLHAFICIQVSTSASGIIVLVVDSCPRLYQCINYWLITFTTVLVLLFNYLSSIGCCLKTQKETFDYQSMNMQKMRQLGMGTFV